MLRRLDAGRFTRCLVLASGGALAASMTASSASGATLRWIDAGGGLFGDSGNWSPLDIPDALDHVIFDLASTYTVTGDASAALLTVEAGDVQFGLSSSASNTFQMWRIASGAGQAASASLTGRVLSTGGLEIGTGAGASGSLRISGADGAFFGYDSVVVGRAGAAGSGSLVIENGGRLSDLAGLGEASIHGSAHVTGAGSLFRARSANIGGAMSFADGATASAEIWSVAGSLEVADSQIAAEIGFSASPGARVTLTGGAVSAPLGTATFDDSTLEINHDASFSSYFVSFHDSELEVGVSDESFLAGQPLISAHLGDFSGATLRLSLLDGFAPTSAHSLHLLSLEQSSTGAFDSPFDAVELLGVWGSRFAQVDFVQRGSSGGYDAFVTFVPSPGAGTLLGLGAAGALLRRRRDA